MKPHPKTEAGRWLAQARNDLSFAEVGVREGFHAQACFMCQQAGEKALKALHFLRGERHVPSHSIVRLLVALGTHHGDLSELQDAARRLDLYYIPTRYPNGLPDDIPANVFSHAQAAEAVDLARQLVERAGSIVMKT